MDQIKGIVKKNLKDPFIDKLLETQMMSVYIWKWFVDIKSIIW